MCALSLWIAIIVAIVIAIYLIGMHLKHFIAIAIAIYSF